MSISLADDTSVTRQALRYTVDDHGRVHTQGEFRVITQQQWDSTPDTTKRGSQRYACLMEEVAKGAIFGVPAKDAHTAWNLRRTLRANAIRRGFSVEFKTVSDPKKDSGLLVLIRRWDADDE